MLRNPLTTSYLEMGQIALQSKPFSCHAVSYGMKNLTPPKDSSKLPAQEDTYMRMLLKVSIPVEAGNARSKWQLRDDNQTHPR